MDEDHTKDLKKFHYTSFNYSSLEFNTIPYCQNQGETSFIHSSSHSHFILSFQIQTSFIHVLIQISFFHSFGSFRWWPGCVSGCASCIRLPPLVGRCVCVCVCVCVHARKLPGIAFRRAKTSRVLLQCKATNFVTIQIQVSSKSLAPLNYFFSSSFYLTFAGIPQHAEVNGTVFQFFFPLVILP